MLDDININGYYDYELCKECGGKCCNHIPGIYHPSDFKEEITVDFIKSLLDGGKIGMDYWNGDVNGGDLDRTLYLRPRTVGGRTIEGSWGGACILLDKEKGCIVGEKERPFECRFLAPAEDHNCDIVKGANAEKKELVKAWYKYQEILHEVADNYNIYEDCSPIFSHSNDLTDDCIVIWRDEGESI